MDVYVEAGSKRTFAGVLEWPGWARSGRDEAGALQALFDYAPRYAKALGGTLAFDPLASVDDFRVVERLKGGATTDFGAPGSIPEADAAPLGEAELERQVKLLDAAWRAFDRAMKATSDLELRKGPRGGGRDHEGIAQHVFEAEQSYLYQLGRKHTGTADDGMSALRSEVRDALRNPTEPQALPGRRPRKLWPPRYFVRRAAWHVLDHAWEIEDRVVAR